MFVSTNPYTLEKIFEREFDSEETLKQKLIISKQGYSLWKNVSFDEKSSVLLAIARHLLDKLTFYSHIITNETGKIIHEAELEVRKCALLCEHYAYKGNRDLSDYVSLLSKGDYKVTAEPKGSIFGVMPWNYPFWQVFRFVIPNIFLGNSCLLKHAPNVGMCASEIEKLFSEYLPKGVFLNLWADIPQLELIVSNETVVGTTLTGSEKAGSSLASLSGKYLKKSVLELGGSDPFIVDKDTDIVHCVNKAIEGRMHNNGQTCISPKRFLIDEQVYEEFKTLLLTKLSSVKVGDPYDRNNIAGTLSKQEITSHLIYQINGATKDGAQILNHTSVSSNIVYPVILEVSDPNNLAMKEELFGPVFTILKYKTVRDAISIANSSKYGLSASIWSNNQLFVNDVLKKLECGIVFVNELPKSDFVYPFGGTKSSGYGRELSVLGMLEFANIKSQINLNL